MRGKQKPVNECDSNLEAVQDEMEEQRDDLKEEDREKQEDVKEDKVEGSVNGEEGIKEYEHLLKVLQADFDNFRKRTAKEKEDIYTYANTQIVKDLLPILDNFERALGSVVKEDSSVKSFYNGIEMIYNQLITLLGKNDVKEINALNEPFDPELHDGIMQVEDSEFPENTVVEVLQKGYTLKDKVIRPSMVKVSK